MCGIVGTFGFQGLREEEIAVTVPLTGLMKERGPDDERFWSDGSYCAFGFTRLAILDLSNNATQPMLSPDKNFVLAYNGEVYNFVELRAELEQAGCHFRSSGDTEVVLNALITWGRKALDRFNGMFALAFYDIRKRTLLLARDHAGIKPLYYLIASNGIVFSSQYDSIMAHPWAEQLSISSDALALFVRFGFIHAPYALLRNTHMLEPGTWMEWDRDGNRSTGRYFEFPMFSEPLLSGEQAFEAVDAAVTNAVRRQIVSDVPVGAFLSGGVDSPLVVSRMKRATSAGFSTYTSGGGNGLYDEAIDAAAFAKQIGVKNTIEYMSPAAASEMLTDVISACAEPFADYSIFPTIMISRLAAQQGVKVLLSGDGGDELFWGYWPRTAAVLGKLKQSSPPSWFTRAKKLIRKRQSSGEIHAHSGNTVGEYYKKIHSRLPEDAVRQIFPGWSLPGDFHLFDYRGTNRRQTTQWMRWNEYYGFLSMVLLKVDRGSMFNGLEVRVPLLDREVLDVAMRIDPESCIDPQRGLGKLPLRYALSKSISYQSHTKRGFTVPMGKWLRDIFKPLFEELVLEKQQILDTEWNRSAIRRLFDDHLSDRPSYVWGLWVLLCLSLWEDRHFKNRKDRRHLCLH